MTLSKVPLNGKGSNDEQKARIRYTCGLMTGMTLLGGTYAYNGPERSFNGQNLPVTGSDEERARVVKFASNKDLMRLGNEGRTFRPVEGKFNHLASLFGNNDVSTDNEFILDTDDAFYYVVFNYATNNKGDLSKTPDYERLGINPSDFSKVTELWEGKSFSPRNLQVNVPEKDVRIYRFDKI